MNLLASAKWQVANLLFELHSTRLDTFYYYTNFKWLTFASRKIELHHYSTGIDWRQSRNIQSIQCTVIEFIVQNIIEKRLLSQHSEGFIEYLFSVLINLF